MFRKVPKGTNWFYTFGSATMFAFLSQAVTGVFLAMYYTPSVTDAYESARHITNDVFLGEFVRGMHKWGSTVMVILIFLHMGRVFFFGAYKYPRELNWIIGFVLLLLTFVMSLTGYLLPFDQRSYWATIVAANITASGPARRPVPGRLPARRSGVRSDDAVALLLDPHAARARPDRGADRRAHLPRDQARHHGAAVAEGPGRRRARARSRSEMNQAEKEAVPPRVLDAEGQGQAVLPLRGRQGQHHGRDRGAARSPLLSIVFGAELGPKADPTTTTYVPRPEWYFFFLFELLRVIKPPELTPLATIGIPTICMILMFMLPFIDRSPERRPERRPIATISGIFMIAAMAYLTYLGAAAGSPNEIDVQGRRRSTRRASWWPPSRAAWRATRSARTATAGPVRT